MQNKRNSRNISSNAKPVPYLEVVGLFNLVAIAVFMDVAEIENIAKAIKMMPCVEKVEIALSNESFYQLRKEYGELNLFEQ